MKYKIALLTILFLGLNNICFAQASGTVGATPFGAAWRYSMGVYSKTEVDAAIASGGGSLSGIVPIASGGTNASNSTDARTNLDVYSKNEVDLAIEAGGGGGSSYITPNHQTATYTLVLTDNGKIVFMTTASTTTSLVQSIIIPASSTVDFPLGSHIDLFRYGVGEVRIVGISGVSVNSTASPSSEPWLLMQNSAATAILAATDTWVIIGHLKDRP